MRSGFTKERWQSAESTKTNIAVMSTNKDAIKPTLRKVRPYVLTNELKKPTFENRATKIATQHIRVPLDAGPVVLKGSRFTRLHPFVRRLGLS